MVNLFPKDEIFYSLFEEQAKKLKQGAEVLDEILNNPQNIKELALKMKKLEKEADDVGHNVVAHLRKTFITPLEGEDIDLLRQRLDDIMDFMEKAANRMAIYRISPPFPEEIRKFIRVLKEMIEEIERGTNEIRNVRKFAKKLHLRCEKINDLENIADEIHRGGLKKLMKTENPGPEKVLEVVKLKEIYEAFEDATDACEDVGNIFETILIKHR